MSAQGSQGASTQDSRAHGPGAPSLPRQLWARLSGAWLRLQAGGLGAVLAQLLQGLRFAGGQGQLFSLRVLALDPRLVRPLRAAGCQVVLEDRQPPVPAGPPGERFDALCLRPLQLPSGDELRAYGRRVREGGLVVVCTAAGRSGGARRWQLAAAFLHAGLADVVQRVVGRYVVTAGQVPRALDDGAP